MFIDVNFAGLPGGLECCSEVGRKVVLGSSLRELTPKFPQLTWEVSLVLSFGGCPEVGNVGSKVSLGSWPTVDKRLRQV